VAIAPRLTVRLARLGSDGRGGAAPLGAVWRETAVRVDGRRYRDRFTGAALAARTHGGSHRLALDEVFTDFPVALLERAD
jgi:maltooligosyltrehalose synthase